MQKKISFLVISIVSLLHLSSESLAQSKNLLACEVTKTAGLGKVGASWEAAEFPPRRSTLRNQPRFIIALDLNNKITEESAMEIFGSNGASCFVRADVDATYCNSPIGNHLFLSLSKKVGSLSDITGVDYYGPSGKAGRYSTEVFVSIFQCQKF